MLNPHGSIASCGTGNGKIFKLPISNSFNILKYFLFCSGILSEILFNVVHVFLLAYTGILYLYDKVAKLLVWSMCSCVTKIALISFPDILKSPQSRYYFFSTNTCIY